MRFREPKDVTLPDVGPAHRDGWVTQVREYELITPLFGGGVEAGVVDTETPISGKGIRGQLRFWWRATRGGQFDTIEEMKEEEDRIWGAAARHEGVSEQNYSNPVQLSIKIVDKGQVYRRTNISDPRTTLGYVAFPLRDMQNAAVVEGIQFQLQVDYAEDVQEDVQATLWAWETFGGAGARTRRGFGAVRCVRKVINGAEVRLSAVNKGEIRKKLGEYVVDGRWPDGVPHLSKQKSFTRFLIVGGDVTKAWEELVESMRDFRQYRANKTIQTKQGPKTGPWGRSCWPEADAVRRRTSHSSRHAPKNPVDKFPRAAFGLPIVFHFKEQDVQHGDPEDTTLLLSGRTNQENLRADQFDRLASPVILRPVYVSEKRSLAISTRLEVKPAFPLHANLVLKGAPDDPKVEHRLTKKEAIDLDDVVSEQTDVLNAFLDFFSEE
ncbi:MAG: type III-B CRISPR module RAMP protein Cmr1 [Ardenticatenales bacterium]|nr:type III-B CRISPR module RAMP protein Cmr1 [Ardenticatenales bacterium]